jgi:hypothetical protein
MNYMNKIAIIVTASLLAVSPLAAFADSTVTATSGNGSSITPSGVVIIPTAITQTFSIGADSGYQLSDVDLDGVPQGAITSLAFTGITADPTNHTITVISQPTGGAGMIYCSGPEAPGWNVSLPDGGCGSSETYLPPGSPQCPIFDRQGCMVPNAKN